MAASQHELDGPHTGCIRAVMLADSALPRSATELGQLQDHDHQDDNDQDPDDDSDNSSVHYASFDTRVDRNFRSGRRVPSCAKRVPSVGPIPLQR
jgi:hypothetical protein